MKPMLSKRMPLRTALKFFMNGHARIYLNVSYIHNSAKICGRVVTLPLTRDDINCIRSFHQVIHCPDILLKLKFFQLKNANLTLETPILRLYSSLHTSCWANYVF